MGSLGDALSDLTQYAVEFRYPGESANEDDALNSLQIASDFRENVRAALDLPNV